jgi:hypothetical protein
MYPTINWNHSKYVLRITTIQEIFESGLAAVTTSFNFLVISSGKLKTAKVFHHDLCRHSATYASRSSVPIETLSKVILRHTNLSKTQL